MHFAIALVVNLLCCAYGYHRGYRRASGLHAPITINLTGPNPTEAELDCLMDTIGLAVRQGRSR